MSFYLSASSRAKLSGVHPDLVRVVEAAILITTVDFKVAEGRRTLARQKHLLAIGATTTLRSRHLTGHAVDLWALDRGKVSWHWPLYHKIADAMRISARDAGIPVEWGGHWETFPDGPHFQLSWKDY